MPCVCFFIGVGAAGAVAKEKVLAMKEKNRIKRKYKVSVRTLRTAEYNVRMKTNAEDVHLHAHTVRYWKMVEEEIQNMLSLS